MSTRLPDIYIGKDATTHFLDYVQKNDLKNFTLVADENEYIALGEAVEAVLRKQGSDIRTIILSGDTTPDETNLIQVLLEPDERQRTYLAVGSGTLTDIVRFASHRAGMPFISLPTAPSVDGFASTGCALTIRKYKQTIMAAQPIAIFADIETLSNSPASLIASGFGDMIGKYTALADWPISHVLLGETFNPEIASRSRSALDVCIAQIPVFDTQRESAIQHLMEGLIEEGICMLLNGNSRPASGAEHLLSHFWEMKLVRDDRPPVFHGAKVGLATILIARYYEILRQMSREEISERLKAAHLPDANDEIKRIREVYGTAANLIIAVQHDNIYQTQENFDLIRENLVSNWDVIQNLAASVPTSVQIRNMLQSVGGTTHPAQLGLTEVDVSEALEYGPYLRKHFTILTLSRLLGIPQPKDVF